MCPREESPYELQKHMPFERLVKILDTYPTLKRVMFAGLGEPFMCPDIFKMVDEIKKRGIFLETVSNGTVLTEETAEKIIKSKIDKITISIDGVKEYKNIRGANIDACLRGLRFLCAAKKKLNGKIKIFINTVVLEQNIDDLENLIDVLKDLPVTWRLKSIRPTAGLNRVTDQDQKIQLLMEKANEKGLKSLYHRFEPAPFCYRIYMGATINWKGEMTPCCDNYEQVGQEDGWNSDAFIALRNQFIEGKLPEACKVCNLGFNARVHKYVKRFNKAKSPHDEYSNLALKGPKGIQKLKVIQ
jgi:MoaA/NifB/PqqE/SkfB family radical SAM enzyme